jgi:uncharacterized membrane protein
MKRLLGIVLAAVLALVSFVAQSQMPPGFVPSGAPPGFTPSGPPPGLVQSGPGLAFCNHTGQSVNIAIGYYNSQVIPQPFVSSPSWISSGWYLLNPGDCETLLSGTLSNEYYYFYANNDDNSLIWQGPQDGSGGYFCTSDQAFTIQGIPQNGCNGETFEAIDIGSQALPSYEVDLTENQPDPLSAAQACVDYRTDAQSFAKCWIAQIATTKQQAILQCLESESTAASFAICAEKNQLSNAQYQIANCANSYIQSHQTATFVTCIAGPSLSSDQARILNCAITNHGDMTAIGNCALQGALTPELSRLYQCVSDNYNSYVAAGLCAAQGKISADQIQIAQCVLNNSDNYVGMGACAVGNHLTPEQQAFVSCGISTGGVPLAFAACVGGQDTVNELTKCVTVGVGGEGCFGPNNSAVSFVANAWHDVTIGPSSGNDMVKLREALLRGDHGTISNIIRDPFRCLTFQRKC